MATDVEIRRARSDLGAFSRLVAMPLTDRQAGSLTLQRRNTVIVANRQAGKSRSLAVLALHWAFRKPGQRVLIVSAGEEASRRLLDQVKTIALRSPLLRDSVVDELAQLMTLSNLSEIRSVPASEKQVRGWTVDLLLVDEAAQVDDELLYGAAIPTTSARPDARIVLAGSPAAAEGAFYSFAHSGETGSDHTETFRWGLADSPWIGDAVVESARSQMPAALFEREFEAQFGDVGAEERVIEQEWIREAQSCVLEPAGRLVYGLDVARLGVDKTVCAASRGGRVRVVWELHGQDLMTVVARMVRTLEDESARVLVDSTGVGAGVLDRLRELGWNAAGWVLSAA